MVTERMRFKQRGFDIVMNAGPRKRKPISTVGSEVLVSETVRRNLAVRNLNLVQHDANKTPGQM